MTRRERSLWRAVYRNAPLINHGAGGTSKRKLRTDTMGLVDAWGWDNVSRNPVLARTSDFDARLYYQVIKGERYWYIFYEVYHPIDDKALPFGIGDHPHDLEWMMVVVDTMQFQVVAGMSLAHHVWYWGYRNEAGVSGKPGMWNARPLHIDRATRRPHFFIEAGGHGIKLFDPRKPRMRSIIYTPHNRVADVPAQLSWHPKSRPPHMVARYRLENLGELFRHRYDDRVFVQNKGQDRLAVEDRAGKLVASPANALWTSCPSSNLIDIGGRMFSPLVVNPNRVLRKGLRGIAVDNIIDNPFLP